MLELTQTHLADVRGALLDDLVELSDRGVRLATDDLGSDHSALAAMAGLPVSILKVDRQLVAMVTHDRRSRAVVQAALAMGSALDLEVMATGVQTPEQAAELAAMGCRTAQGYLWGRPGDPAAFPALVRTPARALAVASALAVPPA